MQINRLRQLAGMPTKSKTIINEDFDSLRKLAGINTPFISQPAAVSSISANDIRRLAGLPAVKIIPESSTDASPEDSASKDASAEDTSSEEATSSDVPEEDSQPAIIKKIATHLEGKSVEEIEAMLMKVYDAGKADAEKSEEESEESEESEEKPEDSSEEIGLEPGEEAVKETVEDQWKKR